MRTLRALPLLLVGVALAGCADEQPSTPVATQTIVIPGQWVFEPRVAEVQLGVPVTFRNDGGAEHTVTFEDVDFDATIAPGEETTYTFDTPGTYEYMCKFHPPDMRGTIVVKEA